ncbi:glutamate--tRNA ligase [Candidatus Dependentiae bacterium]|nr:glutamate--tRNA ligase [Candidatus Dependentiae bacterium]
MKRIRVRFAPSPTGHLHIGGLRTALFNWLFARHNNGDFLLRIEDTDIERSKPEFTDSILESLEWTSIESDEPLVIQTERMAIYKEKIQWLLQHAKAYRCFCAAAPMRSEDDYFKYDGKCRLRKPEIGDENVPHVVRIKLPLEQKTIEFNDIIRGLIVFETTQLDDFIIARTDGTPIYNFVVVVDDALMNISHIIRGEDHISNTPKQIVLYNAFGFDVPYFAHLPLILGPSGARLSKRDAATAVTDYKKNGYLADALCNYLVRLGWAHGDQEIFTREQLVSLFTLDAVGKKAAIFDQAKLDWVNSMYLKELDAKKILSFITRDVEPGFVAALSDWNEATILKAIDLYKGRVKTMRELIDEINGFYHASARATNEEVQQFGTAQAALLLQDFNDAVKTMAVVDSSTVGEIAKRLAAERGIKLVELAQPIRLALTGKVHGPGAFDIVALLGKQESCKRLERFVNEYGTRV